MSEPTTDAGPDDYESEVMNADGALGRDRVGMAWWGHGLFAIALVCSLLRSATLLQALTCAIIPLVWLLFMTLRSVVTTTHVLVHLGPFGPSIPVESILSVDTVSARALFMLGWGFRFRPGSITFSVPATGKQYVRITYTTRRGAVRTFHVMSNDAVGLAAAIQRARVADRKRIVDPSTATSGPEDVRGEEPPKKAEHAP